MQLYNVAALIRRTRALKNCLASGQMQNCLKALNFLTTKCQFVFL